MKAALIVLSLVALCSSAPQQRHLFHEHVEDFLDIIREDAGHMIEHFMGHYLELDEFVQNLEYLRTNDFRNLINELEALPEFIAVIEFLENDNIDILYFVDLFNSMIAEVERTKSTTSRHTLSGSDFSAFITDIIPQFPKEKLAALYEQKMEESEAFRTAVENLQSEEWHQTLAALFANEVFQQELQTLGENGINVHVLLEEIKAVFGQN